MNGMQRQKSVIERSGLGLLPGLGLAFAIVLVTMLALLFTAWWVTALVFVALVCASAAIAAVVVKLIGVDGGGDDHAPLAR